MQTRHSQNTRILAAACLLLFACLVFAFMIYIFLFQPVPGIPSFAQVRAAYMQSEGILLDRNGETLHELRLDRTGRRLDWTPLERISPALRSAVIFAEDRRFLKHRGVDWISLSRTLPGLAGASRMRGASTITMQLAARLDEDLKSDKGRRSMLQKSRQVRAALTCEKRWSKNEILEAYLNLVTFRGELQGIHAAARGLFSKEPQGLNDLESMVLAALVRSPNAATKAVEARAYALAQGMNLKMKREEVGAFVKATIERPYYMRPRADLAPHVALRLLQIDKTPDLHNSGIVSCTLDIRLQAFTAETLRRHVLSVRSQNVHDGAALVIENRSGEILAYVGNIGDEASARFVDGVRAMRQAGSTLKPFVYALAFDRRLLTPVSLIEDSPLDVHVEGGTYRPRNYDNRFHGVVTARMALASSLNVPAVKALNIVGVDAFVDALRLLGFGSIRTPEFYGPSLALGSADVTLWDLANAYRALANGGVWSSPRLRAGDAVASLRRVFSAESAFLISDILSDRESRSRTFALENPLSTRFWTAVKTGTSRDMRDNWCVGFSDRFTVGVWAGNFSGEAMWDVSGIAGAAPVWIEVMNWLHRGESSREPEAPAGIVRRTVEFGPAAGARQEWFVKGTDTSIVRPAAGRLVARIAYPAAGTVVALDPDIPPEGQRVFFEVSPEGGGLEWILDGQSLGLATALTPWAPRKGKHVLKLLDQNGRELDCVDFEVRGSS